MTNTTHFSLPKPDTTASVADEFYRLINTLDQIDAIFKQIADAVAAKAAADHSHAMAAIPGLVAALSSKMEATRTFALGELRDVSGAADAASGYILAKTALGFAFQSAAALLGRHQHGVADIVGLTETLSSAIHDVTGGWKVWTAGNDGAGSGLDADLLDGQHGNFFRNASNLENGTVPDERFPARLRGAAELITDWNDAQSNGWYRGDPAALNSPAAGEWWIGEVQLNEYNAWVFQKVHSFTSGGVETYKRVMQAGIWKPWRRVYETEAEIREASKMVSLPAVPATGTAIDWTSIPAGVDEIEMWFDGISINGTSGLLVQVGTGGVLQTSGYQSGSYLGGNARQTSTSGITIRLDTAFYLKTGVLRLVRSSDNRWLSYHVVGDVTTGYTVMGGGHVTLTGGLDTIRLRAVDAAQTLDAGSVQLRYRR